MIATLPRPRTVDHALRVLAPLLVGAAIYVALRPRALVMFGWCDALGLGPVLDALRTRAEPIARAVPRWVVYSLPDALWVHALTAATVLVWRGRWTRESAPWIVAAPALGIATELGQLAGLFPGTFDPMDLALMIGAAALALRHVRAQNESDRT